MKLIRRAATAFTLWIFAICVWAAVAHLTSLPGPAKASTATLDRVAAALERADPPGALGGPQRAAAAQLRRTAHTAGRVNGRIERVVGGWIDDLGHGAAHSRHIQVESPMHLTHPGGWVTLNGERRITIRMDAKTAARSRAPGGGLWIDRTEKAPAGSAEADLRLRAARHGETWSLRAAEARSALDEAAIRLDIDANLDRKKLKERIEKLLDLLEELQNFEGGR
ncbi:hypothetical protein [Candidatus Palauibacter sp.]|uniref:hypothetical protein n=1 Tax=Candidatus Palauibacter sp. TaxID=3101350 RepID=UPI003B026629